MQKGEIARFVLPSGVFARSAASAALPTGESDLKEILRLSCGGMGSSGLDRFSIGRPSRVRVASSRGRCGVASFDGMSSDNRMGSMPVI